MSASAADPDSVRSFRPTSGTAVGWTGVALATVGLVTALVGDHTLGGARFALAAAVFGLLVHCFMLRPRLVIGRTDLELRNPFASWHVPLAGVRRVVVRAVTRVYTDERRFDGVAVGRPARSLARGRPARQDTIGVPGFGASRLTQPAESTRLPKGQLDADMTADFVVEQILYAADRARAASPVPEAGPHAPSGPARTWAWPELVLLVVLVVGLVLSLLIVALAAIIGVREWRQADSGEMVELGHRDVLIVLAAMLFVPPLFEPLGAYVTLGLFGAVLLVLVARTSFVIAGMSAVIAMAACWYFFQVALGLQLPIGPF